MSHWTRFGGRILAQLLLHLVEGNDRQPMISRELQVHLEEYRAIRSEQQKRLDVGDRSFHYLVIVAAALLAGIASLIAQKEEALALRLLLISPLVTTPFVFVAIANEVMIIRLASYIHLALRPKVAALVGQRDIWSWEQFHVRESGAAMFSLLAFLRRSIFLAPQLLPVGAYLFLRSLTQPTKGDIWLLRVDIGLLVTTVILLLYAAWSFTRATNMKP
jgi:hypothetical protein